MFGYIGMYEGEGAHKLAVNAIYRDFPDEMLATVLAHELTHRSQRWEYGSIQNEILAYRTQADVWRELRQRPEFVGAMADLPNRAKLEIEELDRLVRVASKLDDEHLGEWIREKGPPYDTMPYGRRSVFAPTEGSEANDVLLDTIQTRIENFRRYGP